MVECDDLGTLEKIRVTHDLSNIGSGWLLDKVTVKSDNGDFYNFPVNSWIDKEFNGTAPLKEVFVSQNKRSTIIRQPESEPPEPLNCNKNIGIGSDSIKDYQLTASTSFNDLHLPYHARLNMVYPNSFGGWCPFKENPEEYLQIDLERDYKISGIATQGLGLVDEWTTSYKVKYKLIDQDYSWKWVQVKNNIKEFSGNSDQNTTVTHWFATPFTTHALRIFPVSYYGKSCLRLELYGCDPDQLHDVKDQHEQIKAAITIENNVTEATKRSGKWNNYQDKHNPRPTIYINFDNITADGIVIDESGNKNDVKVHQPVDVIPFSKSCGPGVRLDGGALLLDGDFFIDKPTNEITIAVWIKLFSNGGQHSIFTTLYGHNEESNARVGYLLEVDRGKIHWKHFLNDGTALFNVSTGLQIPSHTWTHIAVTYDREEGISAVFVNSKLAAQSKHTPASGMLSQDWSGGASIGKFKSSRSLNGEMDEFYIFRIAMMPSKIVNLMKKCQFEIDCKQPLGLESGTIADQQITSSSTYNLHYPYYSRLNTVGAQGDPARTAWCADGNDTSPYIQVDMKELKTITGVAIQGLGLFDNWVTRFLLCYTTNERDSIFCMKENGVDKIFEGNNDKNSVTYNYLRYPIATQKIRIKPISWFGNHLCMRFELFGCSLDLFPDPFDTQGGTYSHQQDSQEISRDHVPGKCNSPLGISNGELDDLHFTASSELNFEHQSRFARLVMDYSQDDVNPSNFSNISRKTRTSWCANDVNLRQYIEVDLGEIKNITEISTQGYCTKENWVSSYRIGYSDDLGPIHWYSEDGIDKIFEGNVDSKHIVKNYLKKPIKAQYIRINPRSWVGSHICMRLELFGCRIDTNNGVKNSMIFPEQSSPLPDVISTTKSMPEHVSSLQQHTTLIPIIINRAALFNYTTVSSFQTTPPAIVEQYKSKEYLKNIFDKKDDYFMSKSNFTASSLPSDSRRTPANWEYIIQRYPELIKHGVTASLLEDVSLMIPNLEHRISSFFETHVEPVTTSYYSPITTAFLLQPYTQQQSENDSRKTIIEHFLSSSDYNYQSNLNNFSYEQWKDPNHNLWSEFTDCSQYCGIGVKMRQRSCDYPICPSSGVETEILPCFVETCNGMDDVNKASEWSPFTSCTKKCGSGKSIRYRICDGINCPSPGYETQTVRCSNPRCPVCNINFEWVEDNKILVDISGTGNNAVIDGDAYLESHQEGCGHYLNFYNTGKIILPDQTFRNKPKTGITICLWIRLNSPSGRSSIFATEVSSGVDKYMGGYHLEIVDCHIRWFHRNELSETIFSATTEECLIYSGVWMHLCATYDFIHMSGFIYVDGKERYKFNGYNNSQYNSDWGARVIVGDYDFDNRHFNGHIDDFVMYDYQISYNQVTSLITDKNECQSKTDVNNVAY